MTHVDQMTQDARFWDKIAPRYAKSPVPDETAYAATLDRTRAYLKPTDHVLEVGCGTGSTALTLAPEVAQYRATDFAQGMIAVAQAKPPVGPVSFAVAGLEDTGGAAPYDAVLAFNLLHLIGDLDGALAQIAPLVKPGGLFISKTVTTPGGALPWKLRLMLWVLPLMQAIGKAPEVSFRSIADHEDAIRNAGFDILETANYPAAPPNRFVVARRRA